MLEKAGNEWTIQEAAHLLNRAGFGGSPREILDLHAMGRHAAVEHLVCASDQAGRFPLPEWANDERALADMRMRNQQRRETMKASAGLSAAEAEKLRRKTRNEQQKENRRHSVEAQGWWFRRIIRTRAPLTEKMTLFWHDHFASSIQKVKQPVLMLKQNQLFREHALGSFHELTRRIVTDPAMMIYLDLQRSDKKSPNENFAREVMELFTLGEGRYTENDIQQAARAFTGYRLNRFSAKVEHIEKRWDSGEKTLFGKKGRFRGEDVVNLIFEQPAAAEFLIRKLWEYFVYENPSDAAVKTLAPGFRKAGYRIAPLLREIFLSREFYSETSIRSQIKSPVQFIAQMIRQLELAEIPGGFPILAQAQLGQVLFMPPNVAGWDWGQAWINTNTLLTRYNLAGYLTKGDATAESKLTGNAGPAAERIKGAARMRKNWIGPDYEKIAPRELRGTPEKLVDSLTHRFFQCPVPGHARENFVEYAKAKQGAVFTNQEVAELCHLMMSTPYYQLC